MEFLNKTESFFRQLQYCLAIEPEPILESEKGMYSLMLEHNVFIELINCFQIDYPFEPEIKIIELKTLMNKEGVNINDALSAFKNYKERYWFLDIVTVFDPVTDKLKRTLKSIDSKISENEINIEIINFQKHLKAKRESTYVELANAIQNSQPQQKATDNEHIRYTAKHYVLAYLIECNAKGESFPIGQKKELEKIGNQKMGSGKGNRFYKVFNELINKDLNAENNLAEIGGEDWRTIVKDLSSEPETIEKYLQSKQL